MGINRLIDVFVQSGKGTFSLSLRAKLGNMANIRNFGAKCQHGVDDTAAIQAAIAAKMDVYILGKIGWVAK